MTLRTRFLLFSSMGGLILFLLLATTPLIGSTRIDYVNIVRWLTDGTPSADMDIVLKARLPRSLLAAVAGFALALAGAAFQVLLRNPLADPFTLGVASGAALGAIAGMMLPISAAGLPVPEICAFAGALITIAAIQYLAFRSGKTSSNILILAGVAISFLFSAFIMALQYIADMTQTYQIVHWMMGSTSTASFSTSLHIAPVVLLSGAIIFLMSKHLNAMSAGDETAISKGISVRKVKQLLFVAASLSTASVVSVTGPVGFVGLIIPHLFRLIVGTDHRVLIPVVAFGGASFMVLCDMLSRIVLAPAELPIGILTSLIGGPVFIYLLFTRRSGRF